MRDPDTIPLNLTFVGIEIQYVNRLIERCKCDCQSMIVLDENEIVLNSPMAIFNCKMSFSQQLLLAIGDMQTTTLHIVIIGLILASGKVESHMLNMKYSITLPIDDK